MKTIAFYNVKGGVSKTMSSINVAAILANEGYRVLILDLDPQGNSTDFYLQDFDKKNNPTIKNLLDDFDASANSINDVIYHTSYDGLDIVPAEIRLGAVQNQMMLNTTIPQQFRIRNAIEDVVDQYDFCIIDCHPAAETLLNVNALVAADYVFTPIKTCKWAMEGVDYLFEVFNTVKKINHNMHFGGAFLTQYEANTVVAKYALEEAKSLGDSLLKTIIPKSTIADQISFVCEPMIYYAPKEPITAAYMSLTDEIKKIMGV